MPSQHIITVYPGAILSGKFDEPIQPLYCYDCNKNVGASSGCPHFQQPGGTVIFPIRGIHLEALYHDDEFPGNIVSFKMIHNEPIKIQVRANPGPEYPTIQGYSCMEESCKHIPPFKVEENTDDTEPWCKHFGPDCEEVATPCACTSCIGPKRSPSEERDHGEEKRAKKLRMTEAPPSEHIITVYPGTVICTTQEHQQFFCDEHRKYVGSSFGCSDINSAGANGSNKGIHVERRLCTDEEASDNVAFRMHHNDSIQLRVQELPGHKIGAISCMEKGCEEFPPFSVPTAPDFFKLGTTVLCRHFSCPSDTFNEERDDPYAKPCNCSACKHQAVGVATRVVNPAGNLCLLCPRCKLDVFASPDEDIVGDWYTLRTNDDNIPFCGHEFCGPELDNSEDYIATEFVTNPHSGLTFMLCQACTATMLSDPQTDMRPQLQKTRCGFFTCALNHVE